MLSSALMGMALLVISCTGKAEQAATEGETAQATETAAPAKKKAKLKPIGNGTLEDSLSYAYGIGLGDNLLQNIESMPAEINVDLFLKAFTMAIKGKTEKAQIQPEHAYQVFQHCMMAVMERAAQENKKQGAEFMAENGKRSGVITTQSGIQYEVLTKGESEQKPVAESRVSVHYHGTLLDGTVFDSSVERGNPAQFQVNQVIPGWQEALQLMNVGDKIKVWIPADLAYGDQGAGDIEPGSTLVFEIELLEILTDKK